MTVDPSILAASINLWCEAPGGERWGCFGEPYGKETRWHCGEHRDRG
jgi:hypothetical protein